jgi:hypothetical protein
VFMTLLLLHVLPSTRGESVVHRVRSTSFVEFFLRDFPTVREPRAPGAISIVESH